MTAAEKGKETELIDLNEITIFRHVAIRGSFSAAASDLGVPKSTISRKIAALEHRLGVPLLERSTRGARLTEIGTRYLEASDAALAAIEQAENLVADHRARPQGKVIVSCPVGLTRDLMGDIVPGFLQRFPDVRLHVLSSNDVMSPVEDGVDVAIRVRARLDDSALVMRTLGTSRLVAVASPAFASRLEPDFEPSGLLREPVLTFFGKGGATRLSFVGPGGSVRSVTVRPLLQAEDFALIETATCAGVGIALLPDHAVVEGLARGSLVEVMPAWRGEEGLVHAIFSRTREISPATRVFIDYLAAHFHLGLTARGHASPPHQKTRSTVKADADEAILRHGEGPSR